MSRGFRSQIGGFSPESAASARRCSPLGVPQQLASNDKIASMPQTDALTVGRRSAGYEFLYRRFTLRVLEGPDHGVEVTSSGEETTIGTDQGADLSLTDRTVSRHHAAIRATEGGLELRDLGSKNGTILGGHRVSRRVCAARFPHLLCRNLLRIDVRPGRGRRAAQCERPFGDAIGVSPSMRRVFALLEKFSPTDCHVAARGRNRNRQGSPRARCP